RNPCSLRRDRPIGGTRSGAAPLVFLIFFLPRRLITERRATALAALVPHEPELPRFVNSPCPEGGWCPRNRVSSGGWRWLRTPVRRPLRCQPRHRHHRRGQALRPCPPRRLPRNRRRRSRTRPTTAPQLPRCRRPPRLHPSPARRRSRCPQRLRPPS